MFPSNEAIVETMSLEDLPWDDGHHYSSFMLGLGAMSTCLDCFVTQVPSPRLQFPLLTHDIFTKGNLSNITQTMPIDIFVTLGIVENIHIHPVITVGPFAKWGINFMMCNPHSARGHAYIIVAMEYFTK